jgi:hypothetical protein
VSAVEPHPDPDVLERCEMPKLTMLDMMYASIREDALARVEELRLRHHFAKAEPAATQTQGGGS